MPPQPRALDAGGWAELAVTGRTVSGRLSPAMLARAIGLAAGALLHHRPSGSWAACSAFDPASGRFAAEIDNGFLIRPDGSVGWPRGAPSWRGGEIAVWS